VKLRAATTHWLRMKYQLVIFDLDGTLCDSFPWLSTIINSLADKHHFRRVEDHEVDLLRGAGARQVIDLLGISPQRIPAIARDVRRLKSDDLDTIPLFPGVNRLLRAIDAQSAVLALVSSDSEDNARRALGHDNAALITQYACGASLFGKSAKFKRVLKLAGVASGQTICIGDEIRDIAAARKANLSFGAVSWGCTSAAALQAHAPDHMFRASPAASVWVAMTT
jgi:phosphoglycolate phosphatase